eukprot:scaffold274928_cov45-Prasinocladus_malaysianus.AAC.1
MAPSSLLRRAAKEMAGRAMSAAAGSVGSRKVAVVGAAGGIGQPLSLLMKVKITGSSAYHQLNFGFGLE